MYVIQFLFVAMARVRQAFKSIADGGLENVVGIPLRQETADSADPFP